jgi:hypothetical protein
MLWRMKLIHCDTAVQQWCGVSTGYNVCAGANCSKCDERFVMAANLVRAGDYHQSGATTLFARKLRPYALCNCTLRHIGAVVVQNDRCTGSSGGRTEGEIARESYAAYQGPMAWVVYTCRGSLDARSLGALDGASMLELQKEDCWMPGA